MTGKTCKKTRKSKESTGEFSLLFLVSCFYLDSIEKANENLSMELTLKEYQQMAKTLGPIPYLAFSGGEPFLRRDLFEIIDSLVTAARPLLVSMPTNGAYPSRVKEVTKRLAAKHPKTQFDVQLSLDGPEKVHDEVRQVPGLYRRLVNCHTELRTLQEQMSNVGIKIVVTYSKFNQAHVAELLDQLEYDLDSDRIILAKVHGDCPKEAKRELDLDNFSNLLKKAEEINKRNSKKRSIATSMALRIKRSKELLRGRFEEQRNLGQYCGAGRKIAVLAEDGTVFPCEILEQPLGNIRDSKFNLHNIIDVGMQPLNEEGKIKSCHCDWGCAQNIAVLTSPSFVSYLIKGQ